MHVVFFIILLLLAGKYFLLTAPFVPTKKGDLERIALLVEKYQLQSLCDLGCGNGRVISFLARRFYNRRFFGIEVAPTLFSISFIRSFKRANLSVLYGSFFKKDWQVFDGLFFFWVPDTLEKFWGKIQKKIHPGQVLLSYAFPIKPLAEQLVEKNERDGRLPIYVYEIHG